MTSTNLKPEDLIPGEIYFHKTANDWIIVFSNIGGSYINGSHYYALNKDDKGGGYNNPISSTKELRLATDEEKQIIISHFNLKYTHKSNTDIYYEIY